LAKRFGLYLLCNSGNILFGYKISRVDPTIICIENAVLLKLKCVFGIAVAVVVVV
jgi:hypothetical protein